MAGRVNVGSGHDVPPEDTVEFDAYRTAALHEAVHGLRERSPVSSASVAFVPWQKYLGFALAGAFVLALVVATKPTLIVFTVLCTFGYIATLADRLLLFTRGMARDAQFIVDDEQALALTDDQLPPYTVLVPAYNEPEVVGDLLAAMAALDYPADKLQVLLLLEEDDTVTIEPRRRPGSARASRSCSSRPPTPGRNRRRAITDCTSRRARS